MSLIASDQSPPHHPLENGFKLPPLSLYVHIPWCIRKCPYCDFNSHVATPELPEQAYVDALLADLDLDVQHAHNRSLGSVFIGGGTPSLFSAQALHKLLQGIKQRLQFAPDIEITLEANPGTFEQDKFADYRALGINRLSIGIQSFADEKLQALGRVHSGAEAIAAVGMARQAGFDNFNLDLMHGLPDQSPEQALADLQTAIDLSPSHLSWYQLTMEPNTVFWSKPPVLPEDEVLWDIQEAGQALLAQQGFKQYEVSAYARQEQIAVHNVNYWSFGDFIGIGAGAHGKLSDPQGRIQRTWKTRQPTDYLNPDKPYLAGSSVLRAADLPFEFLMNALRLSAGVPLKLFSERTGLPLHALEPGLTQAQQRGLLHAHSERLAASPQGQLFLNDLLHIFLST